MSAAAFLVSGASGLVYQVAWQRILALHSGVGIYSVAMIVAAFMAGLGVRSSNNLYSVEFFARTAAKLKPGGIMCTWSPTPRIYAAFARAFPHVLGPDGREVVLGSREPLEVDVEAWRQRLTSPRVVEYLGPARAEDVLRLAVKLKRQGRGGRRGLPHPPNLDLFPRDEFRTP